MLQLPVARSSGWDLKVLVGNSLIIELLRECKKMIDLPNYFGSYA